MFCFIQMYTLINLYLHGINCKRKIRLEKNIKEDAIFLGKSKFPIISVQKGHWSLKPYSYHFIYIGSLTWYWQACKCAGKSLRQTVRLQPWLWLGQRTIRSKISLSMQVSWKISFRDRGLLSTGHRLLPFLSWKNKQQLE